MSVPTIPAIVDFLKYIAGALTAFGVILSFFEEGRKWLVDRWYSLTGLFADRSAHRVDLSSDSLAIANAVASHLGAAGGHIGRDYHDSGSLL